MADALLRAQARTPGPRPRAAQVPAWQRPVVIRWITTAVLIGLWQLAADVALGGNAFITAPTTVATSGLRTLFASDGVGALLTTGGRFVVAFALTAVVGVSLGMALGRTGRQLPVARNLFYVLYTLPLVPFYPLFVLWLGLGARSEIAFGFAHGVVPVLLILMDASARVEPNLLVAARSMGASWPTRLRMVILPAILPDVVGALRIGASLSLLGVLLAELMIAVDGVGPLLTTFASNLDPAPLDAGIVLVCVAAAIINSAMGLAEARVGGWRSPSATGRTERS